MICIDYQMIMFCVPKVEGVENEESMWKHSPKIYSRLPSKTTSSSHLSPLTHFFRNFFTKNFVDSIIIVTFAESYPYWKLQLGEGGMDIYT